MPQSTVHFEYIVDMVKHDEQEDFTPSFLFN